MMPILAFLLLIKSVSMMLSPPEIYETGSGNPVVPTSAAGRGGARGAGLAQSFGRGGKRVFSRLDLPGGLRLADRLEQASDQGPFGQLQLSHQVAAVHDLLRLHGLRFQEV